jgi:hypothetical protein
VAVNQNMFGGEFTPFKDLWQSLASDLGITTKRMRLNAADVAAREASTARDLDGSINSSLRAAGAIAGTDMDRAQVAELDQQRQRWARLAQHPDAQVKRAAIQQLAALSTDPLLEDMESMQEEAASQERELRIARRDEYRTELNATTDALRNAETEWNTFTEMLNEAGAQSDVVQSRFRDLVGLSGADVRGDPGTFNLKLGPLGSIKLGEEEDKTFTYSEMVAAASGWYRGQRKALDTRLQALAQGAQQDGFALNTESGKVELEDLNTSYRPNVSTPNAGMTDALEAAGELGPTDEDQTRETVHNAMETTRSVASSVIDEVFGQGSTDAARDALSRDVPGTGWLRNLRNKREERRLARAHPTRRQPVSGVIQRPTND